MASTIPNTTLRALENITGYHFQNTDNAWLALQAAGSTVFQIGGRMVGRDGNKRLALVGDSALQLVVVTRWFHDVVLLDRAAASHRVQTIASNANLNTIGQGLNLDIYINGNPSAGGFISPAVMASTVEAIIGAIFLDSGKDLDAVEAAMLSMGLH